MKAILVIDVPVNDTIDFGHMDIRANIEVKAYNDLDFKSYELQHIKVEPLPQKKIHIPKLNIWEITEEDKEIMVENRGYNKCISEILGETE